MEVIYLFRYRLKNEKGTQKYMQGIIRLGDKTIHGGAVLSCSTTMFFGDIGVARKGDRVSCPEHGGTTIVEGNQITAIVVFLWHSMATGVAASARLSSHSTMLLWDKRDG